MIQTFLKKHIDQIVVSFLLLGPILDLITGLDERFQILPLPFIYFIKVFFLGVLMIYVFLFSRRKERKLVLLYFACVSICGGLFLGDLIMSGKSEVLFQNMQFYIKAFYYPVSLVCLYFIYKERKIPAWSSILALILVLYLVLLAISIFTNSGFDGYTQGKSGDIGWFYSSNEISAILAILLPFLVLCIHRLQKIYIKILLFVVLTFLYFSLGSKTPILALGLVGLAYFFLSMKKLFKEKKYRMISIIMVGLILMTSAVVVIIPRTSFYKNIKVHAEFLKIEEPKDLFTLHTIDRFIFSDRLTFFASEAQEFATAPISEKLVGLGMHNEKLEVRKMVEIDYADIFFQFGILGSFIYFLPMIVLGSKLIRTIARRRNRSIDLLVYVMTVLLAYGLAGLSGHVLIAPSVSVYVAIVHVIGINKGKEQEYENGIFNR